VDNYCHWAPVGCALREASSNTRSPLFELYDICATGERDIAYSGLHWVLKI
jgi:hypothetical protein